jgi:DNA-binding transcriptional LysR family regulator
MEGSAMNWDDARLFLAVGRAGQLLAAARNMGVNQATMSRRISALETALGTKLIIRRTNGCELTPEGETLIHALERAETEIIQGQAQLEGANSSVVGTVRIGAPDGFGVAFLAPQLKKLAEDNPGLVLQLVPVPRNFSLSRREADIAVMIGRPDHGRLIGRKLTDYSLGLYASQDYLAQFRSPNAMTDLAQHRLVGYVEDLIYAPSLNYAQEFWRHWQAQIEISSATGQLEAIRSGAGIGVLHDYLALPHLNLVRVLPEQSVVRSYWMTYHESLKDISRVQIVAQFLANLVQENQRHFLRTADNP